MLAVLLLILIYAMWRWGLVFKHILLIPFIQLAIFIFFKINNTSYMMVAIAPVIGYLVFRYDYVKYKHATIFSHKTEKKYITKEPTSLVAIAIIVIPLTLLMALIYPVVMAIYTGTTAGLGVIGTILVFIFHVLVFLAPFVLFVAGILFLSWILTELVDKHIDRVHEKTGKVSKWMFLAGATTKLKYGIHDKHTARYERVHARGVENHKKMVAKLEEAKAHEAELKARHNQK